MCINPAPEFQGTTIDSLVRTVEEVGIAALPSSRPTLIRKPRGKSFGRQFHIDRDDLRLVERAARKATMSTSYYIARAVLRQAKLDLGLTAEVPAELPTAEVPPEAPTETIPDPKRRPKAPEVRNYFRVTELQPPAGIHCFTADCENRAALLLDSRDAEVVPYCKDCANVEFALWLSGVRG